MAEISEFIEADRSFGQQPRQEQIKQGRMRKHPASRQADDPHAAERGDPQERARMSRHSMSLHTGANGRKRTKHGVQRVHCIAAADQEEIRVRPKEGLNCLTNLIWVIGQMDDIEQFIATEPAKFFCQGRPKSFFVALGNPTGQNGSQSPGSKLKHTDQPIGFSGDLLRFFNRHAGNREGSDLGICDSLS